MGLRNAGACIGAIVLSLALPLCAVTPARAAAGPWIASQYVKARLLAAVGATGSLAKVPVAVEVSLDDDWKTYWRSPGDAGLPPALDWSGSVNLANATLLYPTPHRLTLLGIQTFGYKHDVVFPVDVSIDKPGQPLDLKLKLDVLVCANLCIPKTFDLALTLPAGPATPDVEAQLIAKARASVPTDPRASGLAIESVEDVYDQGKPALQVRARAQEPFDHPDVIAEIDPALALGDPHVTLSADKREATLLMPLSQPLPVGAKLAGRKVVLTVYDGQRALEAPAETIVQGVSVARGDAGPSLLAMLGVALLGGLILNLMPCVLPVLSLKFLSVVSQGGRAPGRIRAGFLATASGIIASFMVLAGCLIAVKAAGRTIGWGLQFQEPAFIAGMAVLVTLFACHLAGLFEVPLPRFIRDAASSRTGPDESLTGHFVTGAFATLLATPCSAPFLGTAVGFALAGETAQMLGIFLALGIGLALPYLLIAAVPGIAAKMPRPGRWMLVLKQAMAIPLILTALWLLSILATQVGIGLAIGIGTVLVSISAILAWRDRVPPGRRAMVFPIVACLALATIILPDVMGAQGRRGDLAVETIAWHRFDRDQIRSLVSQGKTVFVDVTADWCLTCQANKKFVLSKDAIAARLNNETVPMKADWTRPNVDIARYLATYGRYGIPFNIVYGPAAPGGVVLPELLSTGDVKGALDKAAGIKASLREPAFPFTSLAALGIDPSPSKGSSP